MRWLVLSGILAGGGVAAYMKSRDPEVAEAIQVQLNQVKSSARQAVEEVNSQKQALLEAVKQLFSDAVEEGRRAADRRTMELLERFDQLRQGRTRPQLEARG
jgi:hydroxyethylthiazole kinase-like sugar kinase family protein